MHPTSLEDRRVLLTLESKSIEGPRGPNVRFEVTRTNSVLISFSSIGRFLFDNCPREETNAWLHGSILFGRVIAIVDARVTRSSSGHRELKEPSDSSRGKEVPLER